MDTLAAAVFQTDLGWMCAAARGNRLCELSFGHRSPREAAESLRHGPSPPSSPGRFLGELIARLRQFARQPQDDFCDVPLDLDDYTEFQRAVVQCCRTIPIGQTISYGALASIAGRPRAARAVGQVMAHNRFPLIVPCHRVVGSHGSLGGFSAQDGLAMKRRLLALEARTRMVRL
jgi:methylated-DNA-[protein]-cysteine S-methyltransferase